MINQADQMRGNLIIDRVVLENPIHPLSQALPRLHSHTTSIYFKSSINFETFWRQRVGYNSASN